MPVSVFAFPHTKWKSKQIFIISIMVHLDQDALAENVKIDQILVIEGEQYS